MSDKSASTTELDYLADLIGEFIEYWGFKEVQGKVWAHLYLTKKPMDAGTLMKKLGISKALVSMTLSTLLEYKVIEQSEAKGLHGARTYQANPRPSEAITNVLRVREKRLLAKIMSAHKLANELSSEQKEALEINAKRLEAVGIMVSAGESLLDQFISLGSLDMGFLQMIDEQDS